MDWVTESQGGRHFRLPPRIKEDEVEQLKRDIATFADGLDEVVENRLAELVARYDELVENRKSNLSEIHKRVKNGTLDEFSEYFWTLFAETFYEEIKYVRAWMRYWVQIQEQLSNQKIFSTVSHEGGLTDAMIAQAKEHSLEDLFPGEMRHSGNRLFGCCPFHDETTPSFVVYTDDNSYFCYGCQEYGDSIAFLMKLKKLSFVDAVKELQ